MKRISTRAILFIENKLAVMKRNKNGQVYFTLAGGGLEEDETISEGVKREVLEEFGVNVEPQKLVYEYCDETSITYYLLCEYKGGKFGTGHGEEFMANNHVGTYEPMLISKEELKNINLKPDKLKELLLKDLNKLAKNNENKIKYFTE